MKKIVLSLFLLPFALYSQQWYPMDVGVTNTVSDCYVYGINQYQNKIIIGGHFKYSGSRILNSVALWDNNHWNPMGLGVWWLSQPDTSGYISTFDYYKNKFYGYGGFDGSGGAYYNDTMHLSRGIAVWDSTDWFPICPGIISGINFVCNSSCVYNNRFYIGGLFGAGLDTSGFTPAHNLIRWNDTVFSNSGNFYTNWGDGIDAIYDMTTYNGKLILAGGYNTINAFPYGTYKYISTWDDTAFDSLASGFNKPVHSVVVYNGELYAGGYFTARGDSSLPLNYVAKWDGTAWQPVGEGLNDTVMKLYVDSSTNTLYAGGSYTQTGLGVTCRHIAKWTGSNWQEVGGGTSGTNALVYSLYSKDSILYVGGRFTQVGGSLTVNHIAAWGIVALIV